MVKHACTQAQKHHDEGSTTGLRYASTPGCRLPNQASGSLAWEQRPCCAGRRRREEALTASAARAASMRLQQPGGRGMRCGSVQQPAATAAAPRRLALVHSYSYRRLALPHSRRMHQRIVIPLEAERATMQSGRRHAAASGAAAGCAADGLRQRGAAAGCKPLDAALLLSATLRCCRQDAPASPLSAAADAPACRRG